jgi:hypothetical protein
VVAEVVVETLKKFNMQYPQPEEDLDGIIIE